MQKLLFLLLLISSTTFSQGVEHFEYNVDSLKKELEIAKDDSTKVNLYYNIIGLYIFSIPDSATTYIQQFITLAREKKSDSLLSHALISYGYLLNVIGNYPQAISYNLEAVKAAERSKNTLDLASAYDFLGGTYLTAGDIEHAFFYELKAKSTYEKYIPPSAYKNRDVTDVLCRILMGFAAIYDQLNQPDSAFTYLKMVNKHYIRVYGKMRWPLYFYFLGNSYSKKGDYAAALKSYRSGISEAANIKTDLMDNYNGAARAFWKLNETDSSTYYANKVLEVSQLQKYPIAKLEALNLLAEIYNSKNNNDSTSKYLSLIIATKDSLFNQQKVMQMQSITFNEQLRQQDILEQQKEYRNKVKTLALSAGLIALLVIAGILWRNNRQKQKANALLGQQKEKVENTLAELNATQAQLVQREKMASLGELAAGIAHEIQNPLNFVNNFSEVSNELIDEMNEELNKGDIEEAKAITSDIKQNLEKINQHGKRVDAIVKGMLQHSRTTAGTKEPTDINKLADEYLRLAYHGLRAKDKTFNATMRTDFDESIETINIIPQDIGRVLLNLYNNAFYAVSESKKQQGENYEPSVLVTTKKLVDKVEIIVKDNGNGIPQKIVDKIFQPFFTTKPTGQGTGLGLSLAYDIVKAHGGELKVETKEGEGTEFTIQLQLN